MECKISPLRKSLTIQIFQARFGKVDEFGWWDMENQTDTVTQFIYKYFHEGIYIHGVKLALLAPDHHKMNGQVEVTWRTF